MIHLQVLLESKVDISGLPVMSGRVFKKNHEHVNEIMKSEMVEYVAVVYKKGTVHVFTGEAES